MRDNYKSGGEKQGTSLRGVIAWIQNNRPYVLLLGTSAALVLFWLLLPEPVRDFFLRGIRQHSLIAAMLLVVILLAISLIWSTGQRIDAWAFLFFNLRGDRPRWLDWVMLGFTQLGSGLAALLLALLFYLSGLRLLAYELIFGTLTLWLLVELLKAVLRRRRPFLRLAETRIVGLRQRGRSFPSGHTSQIFFLATLLVQYLNANLFAALFLYSLAFLVGITRMYVGAHYPRDVLAGAFLGSAWGLLGGIIFGTLL
jgi:membrane-associated phospholipid phosphatase